MCASAVYGGRRERERDGRERGIEGRGGREGEREREREEGKEGGGRELRVATPYYIKACHYGLKQPTFHSHSLKYRMHRYTHGSAGRLLLCMVLRVVKNAVPC